MSTKIYNGWLLSHPNLEAALAWLKSIRPIFAKARAKMIFERFPNFKEKRKAKEGEVSWSELNDRARRIEQTSRRDPIADYSLMVTLFPIADRILALIYSDNQEYDDIWSEFEETTYYGYWNNTDPDEDCSEEEWHQRENDWKDALPGAGVPSENGLSFTILRYQIPWPDQLHEEFNAEVTVK